jgi:hypothetical protein
MIDFNILKDFEWHRDRKGYRLARRNSLKVTSHANGMKDDDFVILPNGRHCDSIPYRPFARGGDVCFAFASVKSPDELLRFVNNHGPVTDLLFQVRENMPQDQQGDPRSKDQPYFLLKSVHHDLGYAENFRELLRLKAQGDPGRLASYFESKAAVDFDILGSVQLVGDSKRGVRFKMGPPELLGALLYQLGLKLSHATVRVCPRCDSVFETGIGTGLRADARFCCHEHKVEFFNSNRRGLIRRSRQNRQ